MKPHAAQSLVESFGVNIKSFNNYVVDKNIDLLTREFQRLGVKHARIGSPSPDDGQFTLFGQTMQGITAATGVTYNVVLSIHNPHQPATPETMAAIATNLGVQNVDAFEGLNEQDYGDWLPQYLADTKAIWNAVKGSPVTRNIPVWAGALHSWKSGDSLPDISQWVDACTLHPYPGGIAPDTGMYESEATHVANGCPGKPVVGTETGYATFDPGYPVPVWMDENIEGKYAPRSLMAAYAAGYPRTEPYLLFDLPESTINEHPHYGLIATSGSVDNPVIREKPAFKALANTLNLFADTGTPNLTPLDITITGQDANTQTLLFQKSNGHYLLVVWENLTSYNEWTNSIIYNDDTPTNLTITLPYSTTVQVYRPSIQASPVYTLSGSVLQTYAKDQLKVIDIPPPGQ